SSSSPRSTYESVRTLFDTPNTSEVRFFFDPGRISGAESMPRSPRTTRSHRMRRRSVRAREDRGPDAGASIELRCGPRRYRNCKRLLGTAGVRAAVAAGVAGARPNHATAAARTLDGVFPRVEEC